MIVLTGWLSVTNAPGDAMLPLPARWTMLGVTVCHNVSAVLAITSRDDYEYGLPVGTRAVFASAVFLSRR